MLYHCIMTCFWDGILKRLNENDFKKYKVPKPNNIQFVLFLKKNNCKTSRVKWNNESLTKKQLEENFTHVKDFDSNSIRHGYLCSTFEPFLFLTSQLFQVNIHHNFCGHVMKYTYNNDERVLKFHSNRSHFSA